MESISLDVFRYHVPFTEPLRIGTVVHAHREGLLIRITEKGGRLGWGEIAPLPGFSTETLDEAHAQVLSIRDSLGNCRSLKEYLLRDELLASVHYGLELAYYNLCADKQQTALPFLITGTPRTDLTLSALLPADGEDAVTQAARLVAAGCRSIKLKVGRGDPERDAARVRQLRDTVGPSIEIRLDANQAWSMPQARAFLHAISGAQVSYVEEPLANQSRLEELARLTTVPLALDESLVSLPSDNLVRHTYAHAVILKPTLIGGIQATVDIAARAQSLGMQAVISSAFETGVGLLGIVALGAAVNEEDVPVGVDTYKYFARDVLVPQLDLGFPQVRLSELFAAQYKVTLDELVHV